MDWLLEELLILLITAPTVLIALTVHELSHGYVAYWMGDPTPKYAGRLSFNPLKHLDPFGAICLLLFRFGWAKPVPVNTRHFKKPRLGMALTSLAGPLSNLILAFLGSFFYVLSYFTLIGLPETSGFLFNVCDIWNLFNFYFVWLNISLALFNLLPIPPLDGSNILLSFLPSKAQEVVYKYQRYVSLGFFVLLLLDRRVFHGTLTWFLTVAVEWLFNLFTTPFFHIFF